MMDRSTLEQAVSSTERVVDGVGAADFGAMTPCSEWDVHALMNHLMGTLSLCTALLSGMTPPAGMGPGGLPDGDLVGGDPASSYRERAQALLAAATDAKLTGMVTTPMGEMPAAMLAGFTALDIVVHGWDLAVATGQSSAIDPGLVATIDAFARQTISDETRGSNIGPAVVVGPEASAADQLVAFLGRTP